MELFVHLSLIPAVLITVLLSYLQKRAKHQQTIDKVPLGKRFGIVVPVNFISNFSNRWSYGAACGATATTVFLLFFNMYSNYFRINVPPWAEVLTYLLSAFEVGLDYYPFFACLSSNHKLIGSSLGFCYALSWFCVQIANLFECQTISEASMILILCPIPSLVCSLFLMGKFLHTLVNAALDFNKPSEGQDNEESLLPKHLLSYVKHLLHPAPEIESTQRSWIRRKIYAWDPYFKFPTRMIVTAVLCLICLYNFVLLDLLISPQAVQSLDGLMMGTVNLSYASQTKMVLRVLKESWFYSTFPSIFTSVIYIFHLLSCYRKQMKKLYKGASKISSNSYPPVVLAASIRYTGNQIAYLLWGYLLLHILFFMIGLIIAFVFVIPIKEGNGLLILQGVGYTALGIILLTMVTVAQILAAQLWFLQDKIFPSDKAKPLAINNRRAFQNFSYFFMFYSTILGFGTCVIRVILNVFLGSWLLARIDRPIFPRGFESADMGYSTWVGMLKVDLYHTHPVALSFCYLLLRDSDSKLQRTSQDTFQDSKKKKTRTKWHLAYTLLNNPTLIFSRKQNKYPPESYTQSQYALERLLIAALRSRCMAQGEQSIGCLTENAFQKLQTLFVNSSKKNANINNKNKTVCSRARLAYHERDCQALGRVLQSDCVLLEGAGGTKRGSWSLHKTVYYREPESDRTRSLTKMGSYLMEDMEMAEVEKHEEGIVNGAFNPLLSFKTLTFDDMPSCKGDIEVLLLEIPAMWKVEVALVKAEVLKVQNKMTDLDNKMEANRAKLTEYADLTDQLTHCVYSLNRQVKTLTCKLHHTNLQLCDILEAVWPTALHLHMQVYLSTFKIALPAVAQKWKHVSNEESESAFYEDL
ncbi:stimulated by retinoic acid gene 6 protein-like [Pelodytes ibericus]